jgi:hypothetical protein
VEQAKQRAEEVTEDVARIPRQGDGQRQEDKSQDHCAQRPRNQDENELSDIGRMGQHETPFGCFSPARFSETWRGFFYKDEAPPILTVETQYTG